MLTFKSIADLSKLNPNDPSYYLVKDLVYRLCVDIPKDNFKYDPSADGWINLVQPNDIGRVITEIWHDWTLMDLQHIWEGVVYENNHFIGTVLIDNQKGFIFIFPDKDFLTDELRDILEENLDP